MQSQLFGDRVRRTFTLEERRPLLLDSLLETHGYPIFLAKLGPSTGARYNAEAVEQSTNISLCWKLH